MMGFLDGFGGTILLAWDDRGPGMKPTVRFDLRTPLGALIAGFVGALTSSGLYVISRFNGAYDLSVFAYFFIGFPAGSLIGWLLVGRKVSPRL